jgi:hypothetical protein
MRTIPEWRALHPVLHRALPLLLLSDSLVFTRGITQIQQLEVITSQASPNSSHLDLFESKSFKIKVRLCCSVHTIGDLTGQLTG